MARAGGRLAAGSRAAIPAPPPPRRYPSRAGGALMRLAIDTATDRASVALGRSAADAVERELAGARRHAAELLPMIDAVLREAGAALGDVTALVLSDGPG